MGELNPIALPHSNNRGRYRYESSARLINCYAENLGRDGKGPFALYALNNLANFATLAGASGGVRGLLALDSENMLAVAGRQIYLVNAEGGSSLIGGIASDGPVTMRRNRQVPPQVVIVSDGQWYVYQDGAVAVGNDPDLPPPVYLLQKDGYFIFLHADGRWTISGLDDVTIDGLDFATASSDADGLVAGATRGVDVLLFGDRSTEFWQNTGVTDFPFERSQYRGFGCYAAGSVSEITALINGSMVDSVAWAATDEQGAYTGIFLLSGYEASKISSYEIDRAVLDEPDKSQLKGFSWSEDGHVFYTISGSSFSYTYDTVEGFWHERKTPEKAVWNISAHATFGGKTIFGSAEAGTLYESRRSLFDGASVTHAMELWLPIVHASPRKMICNRFKVDAVRGVGLNSIDAHVADPQIVLDISHDGGGNFGTQLSRSLGAQGQGNGICEWHMLGEIREQGAVYRLRVSPGVKRCVIGASIDVEALGT